MSETVEMPTTRCRGKVNTPSFTIRLHRNMPQTMPKEKVVALIDEFEARAKEPGDLAEVMRFHGYASPQSTIPSLRSALDE